MADWRENFYEDVRAFFNLPAEAEVVDMRPVTEERGGGCPTCQYTAFLVEVTYQLPGEYAKRERYEGDMMEFLRAVWEAANPGEYWS